MKFLFFVPIVFKSLSLYAQQVGPNQSSSRIESIEVGFSGFWSNSAGLNFEDMSNLIGENELSTSNFQGFSKGQSCCDFQNSSINFGLNLRLSNSTEKSFTGNAILRLGLSYNSGFYSSVYFEKRGSFTFDTVFVTFQGESQQYPMDSVKRENHNFWTSSERLRMNASVIWRTDPENRWHFYAGVGFGLGVGFNSQVTAVRSYFSEVIQAGQYGTPSYGFNFFDAVFEETVYAASNPIDYNLMLPFGVDFQWSKKDNVFSRLHAFVDFSPSIWFTAYPNLNTKTSPGLIGTTGLRLRI